MIYHSNQSRLPFVERSMKSGGIKKSMGEIEKRGFNVDG